MTAGETFYQEYHPGTYRCFKLQSTGFVSDGNCRTYAIDINPIDLPVKKAYQADLSNKEEIDKVIDDLPDKIDALFLCHGIAGFKGKELLVQKVNFYSQKYMTESLLDRITDHGSVTYIASVGGFGWQQVYPKAVELINLKTIFIRNYEEIELSCKRISCFGSDRFVFPMRRKCRSANSSQCRTGQWRFRFEDCIRGGGHAFDKI